MLKPMTQAAAADIFTAPFRPAQRGPRWLLPAALTALLAACGGGGSGGDAPAAVAGPPTTGAALGNSSGEASQSAQAVVAGADAAVARSGSMAGVSAVFGTPLAGHQSPAATRKQALAVSATPCSDWVDLPCTGSATLDTNVVNSATVLNPGDYADIRFASVSGPLLGKSVVLNGRMRMDFQSVIPLGAAQFPGLSVRLTLDGFGGSVNGKAFGPVTDLAQLQISSQGVATFTAAGASYTGLSGVTTTGPGDYLVANATVRTSYWFDAGKYVDLALSSWRVAGARPAVGSRATVSAAQGSMSILVTSSSTNSVVYAVSVGSAKYVVTATYPPGGGAPTYAAAPG